MSNPSSYVTASDHCQMSNSSFFHHLGLTLGDVFKNEVPQNHEVALNGVQVAPFGLKLCQNDAPDLRIISQTLLDPKTSFKNKKTNQ